MHLSLKSVFQMLTHIKESQRNFWSWFPSDTYHSETTMEAKASCSGCSRKGTLIIGEGEILSLEKKYLQARSCLF